MNKNELEKFLFKARVKTNAKAGGQVTPMLPGTEQAEYSEGDWLYRDVYYNGKNSFSGTDAVFFKGEPVWSCGYFGKFNDIDEKELDDILQKAINDNSETCGWKYVEAEYGNYKYICEPDIEKGIDEIGGVETITKDGKEIYRF